MLRMFSVISNHDCYCDWIFKKKKVAFVLNWYVTVVLSCMYLWIQHFLIWSTRDPFYFRIFLVSHICRTYGLDLYQSLLQSNENWIFPVERREKQVRFFPLIKAINQTHVIVHSQVSSTELLPLSQLKGNWIT